MKKLGIIGAMECEVKIILDVLAQGGNVSHTNAGGTIYHEGKIGSAEIVLAQSAAFTFPTPLFARTISALPIFPS